MRNSTMSMFVFAVYLAGLSFLLIFIPRFFLWLGFDEVGTPWVRILGYIVGALAFFYFMAIREQAKNFYRWTVYARAPLLPFFAVLVSIKIAPPIMVLIGLFDTGCAAWTGWALRRETAAA